MTSDKSRLEPAKHVAGTVLLVPGCETCSQTLDCSPNNSKEVSYFNPRQIKPSTKYYFHTQLNPRGLLVYTLSQSTTAHIHIFTYRYGSW